MDKYFLAYIPEIINTHEEIRNVKNVFILEKLRRQDIINDVMAAARFAAENLPDFLDECSVVYIPEMGHLLAIKEWEPDCIPEDLQHLGFQFVVN